MTEKICRLAWQGFSNDPDGKARPCCLYKGHISDTDNKSMYVQTSTVDGMHNFMLNKHTTDDEFTQHLANVTQRDEVRNIRLNDSVREIFRKN